MGDYKFQILGILIMIVLLVNYFRNKKLPLMSTKLFTLFIIVAALNLIFDASTVYTITHLSTVPAWINRLCHQLYIGTLNSVIFLLYTYVMVFSKEQKRLTVYQWLIRGIPYVASMIVVVFAPLHYVVEADGFYSYGLMANSVFANVGVYMTLTAYTLFTSRTMTKEKRVLIGIGLMAWVANAIVQMIFPKMLLSTVGVILMIIMVYLAFENPREYADFETGTLNRAAFHLMIPEMVESRRVFYLVNFVLEDVDYIQNVFGYSEVRKIMAVIAAAIGKITNEGIYHSRSNMLSIIITKTNELDGLEALAANNSLEYRDGIGVKFYPKYHVDVMECPRFADKPDTIYDLMDYLSEEYTRTDKLLIVNDEIVNENSRFLAIQELVEKAVMEDGFEVFYQPIFSNDDKTFASAEALVRLKDNKSLGFISPEVFIPIAEQKGMIGALGDIVFEKVCRFMEREQIYQYGVHYIEVNLSGIQCVDKELVPKLKACMEKHGIAPERINLEITETASVEAGDTLYNNMNALREYGCHFSMDDFGTGYSNLSQIAKVKFELIKLDKSLIWPCFMEDGEDANVILNNCVNMILKLGSKIVAEGVETKEQADCLTELGVTYLQGYYFSRPVNELSYIEFLKEHQKK